MILHSVLIALALAPGAAQDPAPLPRVSYRASVTLDEQSRVLRGTAVIVLWGVTADALAGLELRAGKARVAPTNGAAPAHDGPGAVWRFLPPRAATERADVPPAVGRAMTADSLVMEAAIEAIDDAVSSAYPPHFRVGRHFEFRNWLPAVVERRNGVPLVGTYLVRVDVPADQVVAATGDTLCGDPGWKLGRRPWVLPVKLKRDAFPAPRDPAARSVGPDACRPSASGRKTLVWYAEDVRDLALVLDPDFLYEEGDVHDRRVRALFRPGQERTWGAGLAVSRMETAIGWLHELVYGGPPPADFTWPQLTALPSNGGPRRLDPMVVAADSSDRAGILLQVGRVYFSRAIAVAPRDSVWLGEGLVRFQADLYARTQGRQWTYDRLERSVLEEELDGHARPVLPYDATDPGDGASRAEFLFHQLHWAVGDQAMRSILRTYWARARFGAAGESLFVALADSVTGTDLGRRFASALRDATPVDYALAGAHRQKLANGRWRTTVEVRRRGGGQFPLELWVEADGDTAAGRVDGLRATDTVVVETVTRPRRVVLDPRGRSHDWNVLNNWRSFGFPTAGDYPRVDRLDRFLSTPFRRDALTRSWAPVAWYNDAGGWTVGLRRRDDYLGRFDLNTFRLTYASGAGAGRTVERLDWGVSLRNPTWLRAPGWGERVELSSVEGRTFASAAVTRERGAAAGTLAFTWVDAPASAYVDTALYEPAATGELTAGGTLRREGGRGRAGVSVALTGGVANRYAPARGSAAETQYARLVAEATGERVLGAVHLRARVWGGAGLGTGPIPSQRRIYFAAPDPYALLGNPFLRSRGALFLRPGVHYHAPGGGGLRGFDPALGGERGVASSIEVERDLLRRDGGLAHRIAVAVFADGAVGDGDLERVDGRGADAGLGLRVDHRIAATAFQTRVDLPLWVSAAALAQDRAPGSRRTGVRWTFSFAPAF